MISLSKSTAALLLMAATASRTLATPMLNPSELGLASGLKSQVLDAARGDRAVVAGSFPRPTHGATEGERPRIVFRFKAPPPPSANAQPLRTISTASVSESGSAHSSQSAGEEVTSALRTHIPSVEPDTRAPGKRPWTLGYASTFEKRQRVVARAKELWVDSVPWSDLQPKTVNKLHDLSESEFRRSIVGRMHSIIDNQPKGWSKDRRTQARADINARYGDAPETKRNPYEDRILKAPDEPPKFTQRTVERLNSIADPRERAKAEKEAVRNVLKARRLYDAKRAARRGDAQGSLARGSVGTSRDFTANFLKHVSPHRAPQHLMSSTRHTEQSPPHPSHPPSRAAPLPSPFEVPRPRTQRAKPSAPSYWSYSSSPSESYSA